MARGSQLKRGVFYCDRKHMGQGLRLFKYGNHSFDKHWQVKQRTSGSRLFAEWMNVPFAVGHMSPKIPLISTGL
jgi:hypothetical protein